MAQSSKLITRTEQNRQKWRQLVSEWEAGDLNPTAFCKKHGLDTSQFGYYGLNSKSGPKVSFEGKFLASF